MANYGVFSEVVAIAGTLVGAAVAITFAWRGRGGNEPASDDVPTGPQRFIGVCNAVGLALLYYWSWHKQEVSPAQLTKLSILALLVGLFLYLAYYFLVRFLTYDKEIATSPKKTRVVKVLGGFCKTPNANKRLRQNPPVTVQQYFKGVQYEKDAVWPRVCTALAALVYVLCYMGAVVSGTTAITSASFLAARASATDASSKGKVELSSAPGDAKRVQP